MDSTCRIGRTVIYALNPQESRRPEKYIRLFNGKYLLPMAWTVTRARPGSWI